MFFQSIDVKSVSSLKGNSLFELFLSNRFHTLLGRDHQFLPPSLCFLEFQKSEKDFSYNHKKGFARKIKTVLRIIRFIFLLRTYLQRDKMILIGSSSLCQCEMMSYILFLITCTRTAMCIAIKETMFRM